MKESPYALFMEEMQAIDDIVKLWKQNLNENFPSLIRVTYLGELWSQGKEGRSHKVVLSRYVVPTVYMKFTASDAIKDALIFLEENVPGYDEDRLCNEEDLIYVDHIGRIRIIFDTEASEHCRIITTEEMYVSETKKVVCL